MLLSDKKKKIKKTMNLEEKNCFTCNLFRWIVFHVYAYYTMNRFLPYSYDSNTLVLLTVLVCNTRKYIVSLSICTFAIPSETNLVEFCTSATEWMDERKIIETWKENVERNGTKDKRCIFLERECIFIYTPREIYKRTKKKRVPIGKY